MALRIVDVSRKMNTDMFGSEDTPWKGKRNRRSPNRAKPKRQARIHDEGQHGEEHSACTNGTDARQFHLRRHSSH